MTLKAKPIVKNEFWVITDGNKKVGNVIAEGSGFDVKIGNNIKHFSTTKAIEKQTSIAFEKVKKEKVASDSPAFAVSYSKGLYVCYNQNCNSAGTVLDLVKNLTNRNDYEALRFISANKLTSEELLEEEFEEELEEVVEEASAADSEVV